MTLNWKPLFATCMKEARLASKIIRTLVKDRLHYPGRLFADTISLAARYGVLLLLYAYVFGLHGGTINETTFIVTAWSMFFYFSLSGLRIRDISRLIMHDVQTGHIEVLLSKPVSYLFYRAWWQIGLGAYSFLVTTLFGVIVLVFFVGVPETITTPLFFATFTAAFFGALILSLLIYVIVGLLAFWIDDIMPAHWIVDKTVMILGGSYLPVAFFPKAMYTVAVYSPFGASFFVTHTVYSSWANVWVKFLGIQMFWIAALGVVTYLLFTFAIKRVSVNGG